MRFWIFIIVVAIALLLPFWCFCVSALCYAFWRPAYELLALGVCIDAYFGVASFGPLILYTATAGGILLFTETVKPFLIAYDN